MTKSREAWVLLMVAGALLASCAGMTAAEATSAVAVTGGALAAIAEMVSPFLSPENQALLMTKVGQASTMIDAVVAATRSIGEAVAEVRRQQAESISPEACAAIATGVTGTGGVVLHQVRNATRRRDLSSASSDRKEGRT